jgi:hypothetical protein
MADPALWFPGARLNQLAPVDGGSILGGKPKCLHHSTETSGFPSYSTGFFPNMTINPVTGEVRQHIPANRAGRALRNETGGVQTNRWNVFQIEWIGFANKVPFHPVGAEVAAWLEDVRSCPRVERVNWLPFPSSFGQTGVRLSDAAWTDYSGHLAHMHAPENDHGDPGWPFPIGQILEGDDDFMPLFENEAAFRAAVVDAIFESDRGQARINALIVKAVEDRVAALIDEDYRRSARGETVAGGYKQGFHVDSRRRLAVLLEGIYTHLGLPVPEIPATLPPEVGVRAPTV